MLKAVFFDIDGVLVDTFATNAAFYQNFFSQNGYDNYNSEALKHDFHLTLREIIIKHTQEKSEETIDKLMQIARQTPYPQDLTTIPANAQKTVQALSRLYKLGLVTGRIKRGLQAFYDVFGCQSCFSVTVDADEYLHPKPHPEPLLIACRKLKLQPNQAVYIGDMPSDLEAAKAAGMSFISYGSTLMSGSTHHAKNFDQIPNLINQISKIS